MRSPRARLAICITRFDPGGQGVVLLEVARRLTDSFDIELFASSAKREIPPWIQYHEIPAWPNKYLPVASTTLIRDLSKFDVIHCHDSAGYMDAAIKSGRPTVVTAHGIYPWNMRWQLGIGSVVDGFISEIAYGSYYKRVDSIVAISPFVERWLKERYNVNSLEIPNGVDLTVFKPLQERNADWNSNAPVLCFFGEVSPRKGVDVMVQALPSLVKRYPNLRFKIGGHGTPAFQNWIETFAKSHDVSNSIELLGNLRKEDVARTLQHADLFVTGSHCEGFALPVVEALACGTPIVTYGATATLDHVNNSKAGVTFVGGPADFEDAVARCLSESRPTLRSNALEYSKRFNWDHIAEAYRSLFESAMR